MRIKALQYTVCPTETKIASLLAWLDEKKALDILALDLSSLSTFTDALIIVSATSPKHAQGLADHVLLESKKQNFELLRMEGHQAGQWILLDLNDVVLHIFLQDTRDMYRLDELWPKAVTIHDRRRIPH